MQTFEPHTLYVIGTPLGNLDELTPRAAAALSAATHIYAEDTRVTQKLLTYLDTSACLIRADEYTLPALIPSILSELTQTDDCVAYVSDAGMPAISDPGEQLINAAREAGVRVEVISGPVAAISALVTSGLKAREFTFVGFLPRKSKERMQKLETLLQEDRTFILYESPKRVNKVLAELAELAPSVRVVLARELTKFHEEVIRNSAQNLMHDIAMRSDFKGECVIVVEPAGKTRSDGQNQNAETLARALLKAGVKTSQAAKVLTQTTNLMRDEAYALMLRLVAN